jgi:predicted amidophosphoribosyltransferase
VSSPVTARRSTAGPHSEPAALRNNALLQPAGSTSESCRLCHLPVGSTQPICLACATQPNHLDAVVPITYAPRGGPVYEALRQYKNARLLQHGTCASVWIAGLLWRFLERHESCLARAAGTQRFDFVTTVPSGSPERDARRANLRTVAAACGPIAGRYLALLRPTGRGRWGRAYDPDRYTSTDPRRIRSRAILLIDDLWVTGGHAQSAAHALREAGAAHVALLPIGRYLRPDWPAGPGVTCAQRLATLATPFRWDTCAAEPHSAASGRTEPT